MDLDPVRHRKHIENLLLTLGNDSEEVADSLYKAGVRGVPGSSCTCPVAELVKRYLPEGSVVRVSVSPQYVLFRLAQGDDMLIRTPPAIAAFIKLFDRRFYHSLMKKG